MIGFVIWPPFFATYKGGQVTKSIIVVKMSCELELLYIIISFTAIFNEKFTFLGLLAIDTVLAMPLIINVFIFKQINESYL